MIYLSDALNNKTLCINDQHLPPGPGNYKVIEFIDLLLEIDYKYFIVLEYHAKYDHLLQNDTRLLTEYLNGNKKGLLSSLEDRKLKRINQNLDRNPPAGGLGCWRWSKEHVYPARLTGC